jgi:hypothetical protein
LLSAERAESKNQQPCGYKLYDRTDVRLWLSKDQLATKWLSDFLPYKPGVPHPVASAPFKALMCVYLFGLWPKIQATRSAGGR